MSMEARFWWPFKRNIYDTVIFVCGSLVQTTDLPGSGTVRSVVGSMGVPLYPEDSDAGYALTKARLPNHLPAPRCA